MSSPRPIVLLGSTGSIGTQALQLIAAHPDRFTVAALAAGVNVALLARQAVAVRAPVVAAAVEEASLAQAITLEAKRCGVDDYRPKLLSGDQAAAAAASTAAHTVVNGITGAIGLAPTLAALQAGSYLALANKESLIIGGPLVTAAAAPEQIIPVDSEHSAIAQCLRGGRRDEVRRLILTASGGPFRGCQRAELSTVTPAQALAHPTWDMGRVVTTNSATLVNKGLEVIEAHLLFGVAYADIEVVVHPQSVVHSMVEFVDGSTLSQASPPSMLLPIALGMAWPDRVPEAAPGCQWGAPSTWQFFPLDHQAFPAVQLARQVGQAGGTAPAVFNAANEVAVDAFHDGRLGFLGITDTIARVVAKHAALDSADPLRAASSVTTVLAADAWARQAALALISDSPASIC